MTLHGLPGDVKPPLARLRLVASALHAPLKMGFDPSNWAGANLDGLLAEGFPSSRPGPGPSSTPSVPAAAASATMAE